jgi:hypothetical protein
MALLPDISDMTGLAAISQPSKSYQMQIDDERIRGTVDDLAAVEQACYKILNTERYKYVIYSWNYGVELQDLFGKPLPYVFAELPRRITEALMQDDRVEEVADFELSNNGGDVLAKFTVMTQAGVIKMAKEVQVA